MPLINVPKRSGFVSEPALAGARHDFRSCLTRAVATVRSKNDIARSAARRELRAVTGDEGAGFEIVAMAASAGGLHALSGVLGGLPAGFPASVVVVQHLDPRHRSLMAEILSRRTPLAVKQAQDGDRLSRATVFIAPPNRHLLVNPDDTVSLTEWKLVHFVRPSADLLFESVAARYCERAIGVILSGSGSDGAMGVRAIKKTGGTVIVQDERTAEFGGMPGAAIQTGCVDFVLPLEEIASALTTLVMKGVVA